MSVRAMVLAVLAGAAGMLLVTAPAVAHHAATVTATAGALTLDPPECTPKERRALSRCDGTRTARVTWSGSCGARPFVDVRFWAARKGGGTPISLWTESFMDRTSGVATAVIEPGVRLYATVVMECYWDDAEGLGPEAHTVDATSAPTSQVLVPPFLREVRSIRSAFCGVSPRNTEYVIQARQGAMLDFSIDFNDRSLLGVKRRSKAGVRAMRLVARGAGIRARRAPRLYVLAEFGRRDPIAAGLDVFPRRGGPLEVWAEIDGERTNSLRVKVLRPGPRGC